MEHSTHNNTQEFKSKVTEIADLPKFDIVKYLKTSDSPNAQDLAKSNFELNETDSLNIPLQDKTNLYSDIADMSTDCKILKSNPASDKKNLFVNQEKAFSFDLDMKSDYSLTDGLISNPKSNNNLLESSNQKDTSEETIQFSTPNKYSFDIKIKTEEKMKELPLADKTL